MDYKRVAAVCMTIALTLAFSSGLVVSEESQIEKLGRMIAGTWAIDATSEPRKAGDKVGKDIGKSVIRFGPGKLAAAML